MTAVMIELVGLDWRRHGRCFGNPAAYDEAVDARRTAHQARQTFIDTYCVGCPVLAECGQWGADTRSTGIFGGESLQYGRTLEQRSAARRLNAGDIAPSAPRAA